MVHVNYRLTHDHQSRFLLNWRQNGLYLCYMQAKGGDENNWRLWLLHQCSASCFSKLYGVPSNIWRVLMSLKLTYICTCLMYDVIFRMFSRACYTLRTTRNPLCYISNSGKRHRSYAWLASVAPEWLVSRRFDSTSDTRTATDSIHAHLTHELQQTTYMYNTHEQISIWK